MSGKELESVLRFIIETDRLKRVNRTGWVDLGICNPESVADHSFSTALLSYIIAKRRGLDAEKAMIMALTHDINEVLTGDIATKPMESLQRVSNKVKHMMENKNHLKMISYLPPGERKRFISLWNELESRGSDEAKLVKEVDTLDYIIQIALYSKEGRKNFKSFFVTARQKIHDRDLLYILDKVEKQVYGKVSL